MVVYSVMVPPVHSLQNSWKIVILSPVDLCQQLSDITEPFKGLVVVVCTTSSCEEELQQQTLNIAYVITYSTFKYFCE